MIIVKSDRALHQILDISNTRAERLKQAKNKDSISKAGGDGGPKRHPLPFPDPHRDTNYTVYRVPIEILSFNFDNGRIAAEIRTIEERSKRTFKASSKEDQKSVGEILLKSKYYTKGATDDLKNSLTYEQKKPAYVTFDAVVIDGNRRMACLNSLHDQTGEQRFTEINICVLPKATQKELIVFENNLQIATDFKQEYGPVNDRLRLRDMKNPPANFTYKEIQSSLQGRWNEKDIERMISEIDLIDKYLSDMGKRNQYDLIEKKGVQSFTDLLGALNQSVGFPASSPKAKVERQKRRLIGFGLITHPDTTYSHIRKYKAVLKDPKASKEFIANSPIYKSGKVAKDIKTLDEEVENLEWSYDFLSKKKAAPLVLLKAAYKKLNQMPFDRVPKKDKNFNSFLSKIEKIVDRLQKKV